MSWTSRLGPERAVSWAAARPVAPKSFRALHASSSVSKKHARKDVDEFAQEENDEDDFDFDLLAAESVDQAQPAGINVEKQIRRQGIIDLIRKNASAPAWDRKHVASETRIGLVRQAVALAQTEDELESMRGVLRAWRVLGLRHTQQFVRDFIGRCIHLKRPDFALEVFSDPVQYGLPTLSPLQFDRLHQAYVRLPNPRPLPPLQPLQRCTPLNALHRLAAVEKSHRAAAASKASKTVQASGSEDAKAEAPAPVALPKRKAAGTRVAGDLLKRGLIHTPARLKVEGWSTLRFVTRLAERGEDWKTAVDQIVAQGQQVDSRSL